MPRLLRRNSGTGYFHVVVRGNNKGYVFKLDRDKMAYDNLLRSFQEEYNMVIGAWCYMNNHVHLLIEGDSDDLSNYMKMINQKFTHRYHKGNETCGHIFQGRYFCAPIDDQSYLRCVVRYIHNNPVNAGMVKSPNEYPWSSYNDFFKAIKLEDIKEVYQLFGSVKVFAEFHKHFDFNDYGDCQEDVLSYRKQIIERVKDQYLVCNGIKSMESIIENVELKRNYVIELLKLEWLSIQEISQIANISVYIVKQIRADSLP